MANFHFNNFDINNINTVLFDKDGTFLDDNLYWGKLAECRIYKLIEYFNLDKNLFEELCFTIGYNPKICKLIKNGAVGVLSRNEVIDYMAKELAKYSVFTNFETISELFNIVHTEFLNNMDKYIKFIPYSENFIRNLKSLNLKLAVVTSDTHNHTKETLKILGIEDCFDCIIGKDDCTKDKKSGEPAIIALEKIKSDKNKTIVIGDALMDYFMAENSGLKHIIVCTGQTDKDDLIKYTKYVVNDLSEVSIKLC
ncbi:MAG: HAD family hydrolase [bacterium]|nr:HAD family hydrolase [bacterium]